MTRRGCSVLLVITLAGCGSNPSPAATKAKSTTASNGAHAKAAPAAGDSTASKGSGAAGSSGMQGPGAPVHDAKIALDECGLHTSWMGDEYCINAPPADKGFQVHIGPDDYNNPDSKYVLEPGVETVENIPVTTGNESDVYYYFRQYRMRPGSHHLIVYASSGTAGGASAAALGGGRRLGGTQNPAKDNPEGGVIAPENQGVGMPLAAKTALTINLHYINITDKPLIKEAWVNFWYRDAKDVTEPANEIFSFAPMNVAGGTHVLLHGSCPIAQAGRALTLYGHRHANNKRFSIWRTRGDQKDLIYEDYDWEHPAVLEYSSLVTNTPPNPADMIGGGNSGILDLQPKDALEFECDIMNETTHTFRGANEAINDEMCILVGDSVGTAVPAICTYSTTML